MYLNLYVAQGQYVERPPVAACLTHSQMNWILPIRKVKTRENGTHAHRWKTKVLADTSIKLWPNAYDISPPHKVKLGRKMDNRMVNTTGQKRTIRPLHYYQCRVLLVPIEFALKLERDGETAGISSKSWAPESVRRPFNQRLTIPASAGTPRPATTKAQQERRRSVLYFFFFFSLPYFSFPLGSVFRPRSDGQGSSRVERTGHVTKPQRRRLKQENSRAPNKKALLQEPHDFRV